VWRPVDVRGPWSPLYAGLRGAVTAYDHLARGAARCTASCSAWSRALCWLTRSVGQVTLAEQLTDKLLAHIPGAPAVSLFMRLLAIERGHTMTDVCVLSADGELLGTARAFLSCPTVFGAPASIRARSSPSVEEHSSGRLCYCSSSRFLLANPTSHRAQGSRSGVADAVWRRRT